MNTLFSIRKALIAILMCLSISAVAQDSPFGVIAKSSSGGRNPYLDQMPIRSFNNDLYEPMSLEDMEIEMRLRKAQEEDRVVKEDIVTIESINLVKNEIVPIRIKISIHKNGNYSLKCLGIFENDFWKICEEPIVSLKDFYESAKDESNKKMALELMDFGNFFIATKSALYVFE